MKLGFVLNDVMNEELPSTTIALAKKAHEMGHEVFLMGVGDFLFDKDDKIYAKSRSAPKGSYKDMYEYYDAITTKSKSEKIGVSDLDVLMLRNDPVIDIDKPWAQHAALVFGYAATKQGVIVLNDPVALSKAINKMYFQHFPKEIRLKSIITRDEKEIIDFYYENNQKIVIKPLQGSAGRNVFLIQPQDKPNIKQMIESVKRDGYIIAQEYFPPASKGDIRLFMVNGEPFNVEGKIAAFKRVSSKEDFRSNIHAGGRAKPVKITDEILELTEYVRPKLIKDGIFFAGLDIVKDKLLEVNIFTPGGIDIASKFAKVDFAQRLIELLEKKVKYKRFSTAHLNNIELNTL